MNDIGFKNQIGCNFNNDKYPEKRHAMQGSLKSLAIFSEEKAKRYSTKFQIHNSFCSIFFFLLSTFSKVFFFWDKIDIKSMIILMSMFLNSSE